MPKTACEFTSINRQGQWNLSDAFGPTERPDATALSETYPMIRPQNLIVD
jgi:hypothetical protein